MIPMQPENTNSNGIELFRGGDSIINELSDNELDLINGGLASINGKVYAHTTTIHSWYTKPDHLAVKKQFHSILS